MTTADDEHATAILHYTDLGDGEVFDELRRRHGLTGRICECCLPSPTTEYGWRASDTGLRLYTAHDPKKADREKYDPAKGDMVETDETGYCSYTRIKGPAAAAEALFRDLVETAIYIKGEFRPLTTEGGEEIVSLWDLREVETDDTPTTEQRKAYAGVPDDVLESDITTWWEDFFDELGRPIPSYEIVADLPSRGMTPLRETEYNGPRDLPDGATWRYKQIPADVRRREVSA